MRRFYEPQAARRLRLPRHMVSQGALQRAYHRLRLPRLVPDMAVVSAAEAAALNKDIPMCLLFTVQHPRSTLLALAYVEHLRICPRPEHGATISTPVPFKCSGARPDRAFRTAYNASLADSQPPLMSPAEGAVPGLSHGRHSSPVAAITEAGGTAVGSRGSGKRSGSTTPGGGMNRGGESRSARRRRNRKQSAAAGRLPSCSPVLLLRPRDQR
jgi:hypothetical protein